jgi:hypothetical protein
MGLFLAFWLIGEGIIVYRQVRQNHAPPMPGSLIASSGLFALLALLAEADQARTLAVMLAAGFDVAAFMNLFPPVTNPGGGKTGASAPSSPGQKKGDSAPTATGA